MCSEPLCEGLPWVVIGIIGVIRAKIFLVTDLFIRVLFIRLFFGNGFLHLEVLEKLDYLAGEQALFQLIRATIQEVKADARIPESVDGRIIVEEERLGAVAAIGLEIHFDVVRATVIARIL
jgi:hypothetical protein